MRRLAAFKIRRWFRQQRGANLSRRSMSRLAYQIPIIGVVGALGCIFFSGSPGVRDAVGRGRDVIFGSDEGLLARRLANDTHDCSGECKSKQQKMIDDSLDSDFLMIGWNMLEYRDPYDCDELIVPGDDDSDDEDCIFELGEGRRRQVREAARTLSKQKGGGCEWITDEIYERDKSSLNCEKKGTGQVCVRGGADGVISPGAFPRVKTDKWFPWMAWYLGSIVYMFIGLAIVCDEFFVPALECFVDAFGISMDVAGATFMAAGGSMPELFTSFIATFQETEVGFVAIVGSAVFNVLFVIAVCAIASTEVLTLTWWPLARDCFFYVIALISVAIVFSASSKNEIHWYEALFLLCEYVGYCSFMKFNGAVYSWVESKLHKQVASKVSPTSDQPIGCTASTDQDDQNPYFLKLTSLRSSVQQILTRNAFLYETAGIAAVTCIKGDLDETFKKLDIDHDGKINVAEVKELLAKLGAKADTTAVKTAMRRINRNNEEVISFDNFSKWYVASEGRIESERQRVFNKLDADGNGFIDEGELRNVLVSFGHDPTPEEIDEMMNHMATDPDGDGSPKFSGENGGRSVSMEQFEKWYNHTLFYQGKKKADGSGEDDEEEDEEGLSLELPDDPTYLQIFWWVITYPLCALLYSTLPDVRTAKYKRNAKMAIVEFIISLMWIGAMSNWLYECLVVVSNTFSIPVAVSAVTLLAGGTSVPDLISSYVVARLGEGDMAVSSSIGSNIFDVTVGLPLPWLMYCILKGKPFALGASGSKGLIFSILLLIVMLVAVVLTVLAMRWRMTKSLGYTMLVFYVVYVLQYLLQKLPTDCNVNKTGVFQIQW